MSGFKISMNISSLKYPPIKHKITEKILYKLPSKKYFDNNFERFIMFSTKKSDAGKYARMVCFPEYIYRGGEKDVLSLCIHFLYSFPSDSGFGTAMLNFARKHSEETGCGGFFHLSADNSYMPNRVPHLFYKKCGMNTGIPKMDKKIDKFIKKHKNGTHNDFKMVTMYYPPIKEPEGKLKSFFRTLFHLDKNT